MLLNADFFKWESKEVFDIICTDPLDEFWKFPSYFKNFFLKISKLVNRNSVVIITVPTEYLNKLHYYQKISINGLHLNSIILPQVTLPSMQGYCILIHSFYVCCLTVELLPSQQEIKFTPGQKSFSIFTRILKPLSNKISLLDPFMGGGLFPYIWSLLSVKNTFIGIEQDLNLFNQAVKLFAEKPYLIYNEK